MTTYVVHPHTGKLIPKAQYRRPGGSAAIVRDTVDPFVCQVTGQTFDSVSSMRRARAEAGRQRGIDYIEVGNETSAMRREMSQPVSDLGGRQMTERVVAQTLERFGL